MREMILFINFKDKKRLRQIQTILLTRKILMKQINKEDYSQPLGALVGIKELYKENEIYKGEELEKEMMVFVNVSDSTLNYLLQTMRKKGISKVDYKAVLTPTNIKWTIPELYAELAKEHAQLNTSR